MQTDTLQSTRCNEAWNGIKDEVNKVELMKNLLYCKNKIRKSKEPYKKVKEKNMQKSQKNMQKIIFFLT